MVGPPKLKTKQKENTVTAAASALNTPGETKFCKKKQNKAEAIPAV